MGEAESFDEVLAAAVRGESWALAHLWRNLNPRLVRYLRTVEPGAAEDLASETWIAAANALGRFKGDEDGFRAWLFTIARRRLIDHRRRSARRRVEPVPEERFATEAARNDTEAEATSVLTTEEALRRIATLPPDQAEAVLLRVLGDLPVATVAELMGKSAANVRVLQHRGLRRLAQQLQAGTGSALRREV